MSRAPLKKFTEDPAALVWLDKNEKMLLKLAHSFSRPSVALGFEDLVQVAKIEILRSWDKYADDGRAQRSTYLYSVARHAMQAEQRRLSWRRQSISPIERELTISGDFEFLETANEPVIEDGWDQVDFDMDFKRRFAELSPRQRFIYLANERGITYEKIAKMIFSSNSWANTINSQTKQYLLGVHEDG